MGVRFICPNGHKLHVKAFLAGKRGICPHCDVRFDIPRQDTGRVAAVPVSPRSRKSRAAPAPALSVAAGDFAAALADAAGDADGVSHPIVTVDAAEEAQWYVRPAGGGQYGPASDSVLRQWIDELRVAADSLVRRDDWPDWRRADDVFVELTPAVPDGPALDVQDFAVGDEEYYSTQRHVHLPSARSAKKKTQRLVLILGVVVCLLAAVLVLIVVNLG